MLKRSKEFKTNFWERLDFLDNEMIKVDNC